MSTALVIPSLHPSPQLVKVVASARGEGSELEVIVVDDGSGPEYAHVFDEVSTTPGCTVLRHDENLGKGAALKTAFRHCAQSPELTCVVTADSDGQHDGDDIQRVAAATERASQLHDRVSVLGVRDFTRPDVPFKSRVGNRLTTAVVWLLAGQKIQDTQTGLRGFSRSMLTDLVQVRGSRFEYESNVLMWALHNHIALETVPIETIYHDATNSQTHFRPLQDSIRVYANIFRQAAGFALASGLSAVVDLLVFTLVINGLFYGTAALTAVATATLVARLLSSLVNFSVNKQAVFAHRGDRWRALSRYYTLAAAIITASSVLTTLLGAALAGHVVWAKILVDGVLFGVSFVAQKRWVFRSTRQGAPAPADGHDTGGSLREAPSAFVRRS